MSLNYLATRFTCSWPWSIAVMLCDGRIVCGCADPVRQARARRLPDDVSLAEIWRGPTAQRAARGHQHRRLGVLRRLPAEAAAGRRRGGAGARSQRRAAAQPAVHRVHRRLQHLVLPGLLRAGNRHHAHAPGRHARLGAVHARRRRGRAVARPHRLLQLRRSVPAQARRRDVRVHQDEVPAHLPLHEHQRPGAQRGEGAAAGALGHRRGHLLDRRRVAGHLRPLSSARQVRRGDRQPARHGRREGPAAAATCRSSTGATSSSRGTTPTRRWRARGGSPPRSASIGCAGRSPITPRTRSRAASLRAPPTSTRISTRSGTTTTSATPFPAPRRAPRSTCRTLPADCRWPARAGETAHRADARPQPVDAPVPRAGQLRPPAGAPRRAAARADGADDQSRSRARVAARRHPARRQRRCRHRGAAARDSRAATR